MEFQALIGIAVPFFGTVLGSLLVFFMKSISARISALLGGFAGGVMVSASVFSLLIPAMEWSAELGVISFLPPAVGFALGILFFLALDNLISCVPKSDGREVVGDGFERNMMLTLAVAMHNLPEGIAVGVVYAWLISGIGEVSAASAFALAVGVGIQNFPEGAIISLPAAAGGMSRIGAFSLGIASALVEALGAVLAITLTAIFLPVLPYLLGFAAGAMIYVVVEELIPDAALSGNIGGATVAFSLGFLVMMILDVALG